MTQTLISNTKTIKFLYSYGGKILPRRTDGKLRYVGGLTRVLSAYRSSTFAELMVKFEELCGSSMNLKCKLPSEDLDVLVSITNDEDLANLISEYDRFSSSTNKDLKITAILSPIKSLNKISPVCSLDNLSSAASSADSSPTASPPCAGFRSVCSRCRCQNSSPASGKVRYHLHRCVEQRSPRHIYVVHCH